MSTPVLSGEFRDFLIEAKQNGYGSERAEKHKTESGAYEIVYERDGYRYTDNYIGGDPFIGYEHVSARHPHDEELWVPVWGMNYSGGIIDSRITPEELGDLLGKALARPDKNLPIRGPRGWSKLGAGMIYEMRHQVGARLEEFSATELIYELLSPLAYVAHFSGRLAARNVQLESLSPPWLAKD